MANDVTDSYIQVKDGDWGNLNRSLRYIYNQLNAITGNTGTPSTPDKIYTPEFTNLANLNIAPIGNVTGFVRVLNTVIVFGEVTFGTILPATASSFEMSLPIVPKFKNEFQGAGVAYSLGNSAQGASILAKVANQTAIFQWISVAAAIDTFSFVFVYPVN